ncbi:uridine diphosphate-N-acetylglucosamine-binding protein YvcK [Pasteurella skyensis]|uniref:Putative gluconeogenesis factor n=1 Tax=Phocoenobacter skyensis TaxID=97481 RepID=A0AAJ6NF83_9PAST|nr:uridine diphosphate-N-acetylglucosamine-binding protein YvcK [Pasteurella skyensis]MDP8170062.1 uridine diphosphate-N-acetylglucosamine-binding protein YvcK [Pasteurella skyensis]MDP8175662.1 uridine diphosphate-N-acetylglucosamine-binding protein YvcK [Pasteurella skyensis]
MTKKEASFSDYPYLSQLNNVVALGGGHGLGRVLSSISFLENHLTGIVTTTDNGNSTGRIRLNYGGIAWGDLRNCLNQIVATPTVASKVFEYRFKGEGELLGHNLGNLIFTALADMQIRPLDSIKLVRTFLGVKVNLIPMSETPTHLSGILSSGKTVVGEVSIDTLDEAPYQLSLSPNVQAPSSAIQRLNNADLIILGPGSFFTSILPPLLISEIAQAISHSKAKVIFIDNLGKEQGAARNLDLVARIQWLERLIGNNRIDGIITGLNPDVKNTPLPKNITVLTQDLCDNITHYLHDRKKLSVAIDNIIALLNAK